MLYNLHFKVIYQKFTVILQSQTAVSSSKNVMLVWKVLYKIKHLSIKKVFILHLQRAVAKSSNVAQVITSIENEAVKNIDSNCLMSLQRNK